MPRLTLSYALEQIHPPFEPLPDDQGIVNDVEVRQRDGTFAHVQEETGPLSVLSPPNGVGRYDTSITVDAHSADQLPQIASWIKTLGTQDVERYPTVHVNLASNPDLIADAATVDTQDRLVVTDLPSWMPPDDPDLVIEGYTETISQFSLDLTFNCSPGNVYQQVGVWELMSHELHAAINSSVTSVDIANTDITQPMLATSGLGSGYGAIIGGEEMQVTAVAASTPAHGGGQVGASHAVNANVTPGLPSGLAAGHLILIFAMIRNSGAGVPDTPSGYTRLPVFPATSNAQLFAKIATSTRVADGGSEANPAISFTGGVAGADTSAYAWKLTGKWHDVDNLIPPGGAAWRLNPSAQDIAYPGLPVTALPDDCHIVYLGWKQDDCSSIAAILGVTFNDAVTTSTGDDQCFAIQSVTQTTAESVTSGAFSVTGGGAAISRSAVVALRCDYQTATVTRGTNGTTAASHSAGDDVTLARPMRWGLL